MKIHIITKDLNRLVDIDQIKRINYNSSKKEIKLSTSNGNLVIRGENSNNLNSAYLKLSKSILKNLSDETIKFN